MATENERDLHADLAICAAATPGPWIRLTKYECAIVNAETYSEVVTAQGGDMCYVDIDPDDERFILEAREGWPEAIRRAIAAESEVERLRGALETAQFHLSREHYMSAEDTVDSALEVA